MELTRRGAAAALASVRLLPAQGNPEKLGIIGLGNRARVHLSALTKMPEGVITALCDIESARTAQVNGGLSSKAAEYTDYRELIRDRNVSTVVIVAPNYLHHEMAMEALRAGKNLVLEKPLGINYEQALSILRAAKRSGRTVAVCMQRRYTPQDQQVVEAVERGLVGDIKLVQYTEMRGDWNPASWKYTDAATGAKTSWRLLKKTAGSTELEFSIHSLAHVCQLVKAPFDTVYATGGTVYYTDGRDTRDLSSYLVRFASGARLSYSFSCFAPGGGPVFSILGSKGVLRREKGELLYHPHKGKPEVLPVVHEGRESSETLFYRDFFADVRAGRVSALNPEFALEPMKIAFAADRSIERGSVVTARDFPPPA